MIFKGCSSIAQLSKISIFKYVQPHDLEQLIPYSYIRQYSEGEIVILEGEQLEPQLFALVDGFLQINKTTPNGKESILRHLPAGEIFAAPALFGKCLGPATVTAQLNSEILTVKKEALLRVISKNPEVAFRILEVFHDRMQRFHTTIHSLISERAIVRLIKLIKEHKEHYGTQIVNNEQCLNGKISHYQIARTIGITYEECVRLFKKLQEAIIYKRGGKIIIKNWEKLEEILIMNEKI